GLPYIILTVSAVIALVISPVEEFLAGFEVGLPFPQAETGFNVTNKAEEPYSPFAPFTHPGTFLLIASIGGWATYRAKGYYEEWSKQKDTPGIWSGLLKNAVPSSIAIISFLVMSKIMGHSGQTEVLALGIVQVAPPPVFAFFSNWIGVLGAFMTSSN